jgi:RNase adapter protein RapZ
MNVERFLGPFVVTGLSGAGKTVLSRSLEDIGYLCVDNIPLDLVLDLFERSEGDRRQLVVVVDVRAKGLTTKLPTIYRQLVGRYPGLRLVYVEASPETVLRRFSIARRPHPLRDRSLEQAIADERRELQEVRTLADLVIDTSNLSPHDLRRHVLTLAGIDGAHQLLAIEVQSFSYLQGVPPTASLVFDVRFLPNPFFETGLRSLAGDDPAVVAWLDASPQVGEAVERILALLAYLLPRYAYELKTQLSVAFGCTGGRHRSVYVAERAAVAMRGLGYEVSVHHRDKERWR